MKAMSRPLSRPLSRSLSRPLSGSGQEARATLLVNTGDGGHVSVHGNESAIKNGTNYYGGGIRSVKNVVNWHWDGTTLERETSLYSSPKSDTHNGAQCLWDNDASNLVVAQCDHSNATSNNIRFYVSTTGDVNDLTLKATILSSEPTYVQIYRDGTRILIVTRQEEGADARWFIWSVADYTVASPVFTGVEVFIGSYIDSCADIDGNGIHFCANPIPFYPGAIGGGNITTGRVWGQTLTYGFLRFSDDAILINGQVEVADYTVMANPINLQSRNMLGYTDNFELGDWNTLNTSATFVSATEDRWGKTNAGVGLGVIKVRAEGGSGTHVVRHNNISITAGQQYTVSVYVKDADRPLFEITGPNGSSNNTEGRAWIRCDASTETIEDSSDVDASGVEDVPDMPGWSRYWMTATADNTVGPTYGMNFFMQTAGWSYTFSDNGNGIYIGSAQFELGGLTTYVQERVANAAPSNQPPIIYGASEGEFLRLQDMRHKSADTMRFVYSVVDGPDGVTTALLNQSTSNYYQVDLTISTQTVASAALLGVTGSGAGDNPTYFGGAAIMANGTVFIQLDRSYNGIHFLNYREDSTGSISILETTSGVTLMRAPRPVILMEATNTLTNQFIRMKGPHTTWDENWGPSDVELFEVAV